MANDYFASKGWLTKYAKAEDSTGAWQKYVAEVQRSEMDNFNTPDLDQGADSILRPGETLDDFDVTFRRPNAEGGRQGFYKGSSAVKSHGDELIKLAEAGGSSRSIAKKLGLNQQTVNDAINSIDKGLAGENYKFSKPFKDIVTLRVTTGKNLKDPKYIKILTERINEPKYRNHNMKGLVREGIITDREYRELSKLGIEAQRKGRPYSDIKAKARREADEAWTKKYSSLPMEGKTRGDMSLHRQHAGSVREKVGTENTMFLESKKNTTEIRPFEKAIDEIQLKQYQTELNRNMPIEEKRKIFDNLKKQEAALRAANPEFSKYKSSLVFEESALSPKTGYMKKEVMSNPELTISEGKTGQKFTYKNVKPSSTEGKKIIELSKISKVQSKGIATKLDAAGFKCQLANGLTCNDPRAYAQSIKETMQKASQADKSAISSIKKMGKLMNGFKGAAKWTGWGLLGEIGFAAPLAGLDYAKGANTDEIISNATYGLFGKSEDEQLRKKYSDYGQAKDFQNTYDKLLKQENSLDDQTGYGSIPVNQQVIKDTENKLREQSKEFAEVLPPSMGFKGEFDLDNFMRRREIDAQRDAEFAAAKQKRSDELGIIKPSTGLEAIGFEEGGLADLMKKYNDKK